MSQEDNPVQFTTSSEDLKKSYQELRPQSPSSEASLHGPNSDSGLVKHASLNNFLHCSVCFKHFHHAVEINCGHVFCKQCVEKAQKNLNMCPICETEILYVHPSYIVRELVGRYGGTKGENLLRSQVAEILSSSTRVENEDDPIIVACQFKRENSKGGFDPADLRRKERIQSYLSDEEFVETVNIVNEILHSTGCAKPSMFPCLAYSPNKNIINVIDNLLGDCNARWHKNGLWWTLLHLHGKPKWARSLDENFFLILRIDPVRARAYQVAMVAGREEDLERLRRENLLLRHKLLEFGKGKFIQRITTTSCQKTLHSSTRYDHYSEFSQNQSFGEELSGEHIISFRTLRELMQYNPRKPAQCYFLPPRLRVRSVYSGHLPLTKEEEMFLSRQFSRRSMSVNKNQRRASRRENIYAVMNKELAFN